MNEITKTFTLAEPEESAEEKISSNGITAEIRIEPAEVASDKGLHANLDGVTEMKAGQAGINYLYNRTDKNITDANINTWQNRLWESLSASLHFGLQKQVSMPAKSVLGNSQRTDTIKLHNAVIVIEDITVEESTPNGGSDLINFGEDMEYRLAQMVQSL